MPEETSNKPQKNGGKGKLKGASDGIPFGKQKQPSSKAKSDGWKKKRLLKNLINISTSAKFNDQQKAEFRKLAAAYFGIPEKHVTIETIMDFRQIEKSIAKGDTFAYNSVKEWVYGKPKQPIDMDANMKTNSKVVFKIGGKRVEDI